MLGLLNSLETVQIKKQLRIRVFAALIGIIVFPSLLIGQTVVFNESFNEASGSTSGTDNTGGVTWNASCPTCLSGDYLNVTGGQLENNDSNGFATWTTNPITTGCGNVEICFDINLVGTFEGCFSGSTGCNATDFVALSYSIDGGPFQNPTNSYSCPVACAGLNVVWDGNAGGGFTYCTGQFAGGSNIVLQITTQTWAQAEYIGIDDITVTCYCSNPVLNITNPASICASATTDLTVPAITAGSDAGTLTYWTNAGATVPLGAPTAVGPGTYYIQLSSGGCATVQAVTVGSIPTTTPTFNPVPAVCQGDPAPVLPTTSLNGITGSWSPAVSTASAGTTTYTFTPTAGQCASTTTLNITVTALTTPTFNPVAAVCQGDPAPVLPTTSLNGITGTWAPAVSTASAGTTTYTFTPTAGQCASTTTLNITVTALTTPTFDPVAAVCLGDPAPVLPTTSLNGITGTWSPAVSTATAGTTTYTFTPTSGQCASSTTLNIVVNNCTVPPACPVEVTFTQVVAGSCIVNQDGGLFGGDEDPAIAIYCDASLTAPLYFAEWPVNIGSTGTYGLPGSPWGPCGTTNSLTFGIPAGSYPFYIETFESDNGTCGGMVGSTACNNAGVINLDLTAGIHTISSGDVSFNYSVVETQIINNITAGNVTCTGGGLFDVELTVDYTVPTVPCSLTGITLGDLNVNGQTFSATGSPQTITLSGLSLGTPIDVNAYFDGSYSVCDYTAIALINQPLIDAGTPSSITLCASDPAADLFSELGGTPDIGGVWSPVLASGTGVLNPAVDMPGTYTYTVGTGTCAVSADVDVTINSQVTPTFNPVAAVCQGDPAPVLPTTSLNGITGTWSPAVSTASAGTTTYTFTPTAGQCASTTTLNITVTALTTPTFNPVAAVCLGDPAPVLPTTSLNGITGTWSPAVSTAIAGTTTYTFTPTAGQCASSTTLNITVTALTTPTFNPVAAVCQGDPAPVLLTTSLNGITGTWSPGVSTATAGTTTYTFTPAMGQCATITTLDITVTLLTTPTFDPVAAVCQGVLAPVLPTTSLNGITGTWSPAVSTAAAGTTAYTFTPTAGQCTSTTTLNITVNSLPAVSAGSDILICDGESVILSASGAVNYTWSGSVTNGASFVPTISGTYTVTGTDANGCQNMDDMLITIETIPQVTFTASAIQGCAPLTVTLTNTTAGSLGDCVWNVEGTGILADCGPITIPFNAPGLYDVSLQTTTTNGCTNSVTYTDYIYIEPSPFASFTSSEMELTTLNNQVAFNNTSLNAVDYLWNFGDYSSSTSENVVHVYDSEIGITYLVELVAYSQLGCTDTARMILPLYEELLFWVPNTFTPDNDEFNQSFKPVFTQGFDPYDFNMLIFNRWGEVVFETNDHTIGWDGSFGLGKDRGNFESEDGVYTWKIEFKTLLTDERIMKIGHVNVLR